MLGDGAADDHTLASRLATEAGRHLVRIRDEAGTTHHDVWALRDRGDLESHHLLVAALAAARPDDKVLSEEGLEDRRRLSADRVWILDPLDGTREYGDRPRTDWAVHVALVVRGQPVAAAVSLPAVDLTFSTGAPLPELPPLDQLGRAPRIVVSRSRPPATVVLAAEAIDADLVPLGSAGAKAMAVVMGDAEVYAHAGGQYEWDSAAPVGVAAAAGLHTSRIDGTPLVYNRPDPWLPDLLICRPELAAPVIAAMGF